jgi:hypothetical protein
MCCWRNGSIKELGVNLFEINDKPDGQWLNIVEY